MKANHSGLTIKKIKAIYFGMVALISLIILVVSSVQFINIVASKALGLDSYRLGSYYRIENCRASALAPVDAEAKRPPFDEKKCIEDAEKQIELEADMNFKNSLVSNLAFILVFLPVWSLHFFKFMKTKEDLI